MTLYTPRVFSGMKLFEGREALAANDAIKNQTQYLTFSTKRKIHLTDISSHTRV